MRVDMVPVNVCPDHHLIPGQMLMGELLGQLKGQLWRDLSRGKGLDDVVRLPSIGFADSPLGVHHLLVGMAGVTVQISRKHLFLGLILIGDVSDQHVQTAVFGENLCDGHYSFAIS